MTGRVDAESPDRRNGGFPSMAGFVWSARVTLVPQAPLGVDYWCVRDAFSALMGWAPGTDEWCGFIEAPEPSDMDRLADHLGLVWFDPDYKPHQDPLRQALAHPGVACYKLHRVRMAHCQSSLTFVGSNLFPCSI